MKAIVYACFIAMSLLCACGDAAQGDVVFHLTIQEERSQPVSRGCRRIWTFDGETLERAVRYWGIDDIAMGDEESPFKIILTRAEKRRIREAAMQLQVPSFSDTTMPFTQEESIWELKYDYTGPDGMKKNHLQGSMPDIQKTQEGAALLQFRETLMEIWETREKK